MTDEEEEPVLVRKRSCIKKGNQISEPNSGSSSRKSSGSKAVMFSDEIGEALATVTNINQQEPIIKEPPPKICSPPKPLPPEPPKKKPQEYRKNNPVGGNTREQKLSLAEQADLMFQQSTQEDEDEEVEHEKESMTRKTNNTNRLQSLQGIQAPSNTPQTISPSKLSTKDATSTKSSSEPHDRGIVRRGSSAGIPVGGKGVKMKMVLPRGDPAVALVFSQPEVPSPTSPRPAITITPQDGLEQGVYIFDGLDGEIVENWQRT